MFRKRFGVSEIHASLILLVIVSTGGAFLYNVTLETLNNYEETLTFEKEVEAQRILERFCIVSIGWEKPSGNLTLIIYNFGEYDIKIEDVYVDGYRTAKFFSGDNEIIEPGQIWEVRIQAPITISSDNEYALTTVSERGVIYEYLWYS
jgi:hypothetical protein